MIWFVKKDQPTISPLVMAICQCLELQPNEWKISYAGALDPDLAELYSQHPELGEQTLKPSTRTERIDHKKSGVRLALDIQTQCWDLWHPRYWTTVAEDKALRAAINAWGAVRLLDSLPRSERTRNDLVPAEPERPSAVRELDMSANDWPDGLSVDDMDKMAAEE